MGPSCPASETARLTAPIQIDDAVEVKQVTKTNETETRRPLGVCLWFVDLRDAKGLANRESSKSC